MATNSNRVFLKNLRLIKKRILSSPFVREMKVHGREDFSRDAVDLFCEIELLSKHFGLLSFFSPIGSPKKRIYSESEKLVLSGDMTTAQRKNLADSKSSEYAELLKHEISSAEHELKNLLQEWDEMIDEECGSMDENVKKEVFESFQNWLASRNVSEKRCMFNEIKNFDVLRNILWGRFKSLKNEIKSKFEKIDGDVYEDFTNYEKMFPMARSMKRKLIFNVGPTNSGKTHDAMESLSKADSGVYLAPLRLMAMENYERLKEAGLPVNMITGEERIVVDDATHVSQTIETLNLWKVVDVAVIDEVQLISDLDRGWAWTQAVIGVPASTVIMTGSVEALPYLKKIAEMTGDELEIKKFSRKSPLVVSKQPTTTNHVKEGDAIIAFSRAEVLRLKDDVAKKGHRVSVIYGALSPEVRRSESKRFRNGETDILVATDAIGMGLNLPIRRVVFSTLVKFDGDESRKLYSTEIRQIGGRAGRYGLHESGEVTVFNSSSINYLREKFSEGPVVQDKVKLLVMPPWNIIEHVSRKMGTDNLWLILSNICEMMKKNRSVEVPSISEYLLNAETTSNSGLDLKTRYAYLGCPVDHNKGNGLRYLRQWVRLHGSGELVFPPDFKRYDRISRSHDVMSVYEDAVKVTSSWLWLSLKFPNVFVGRDEVPEEIKRLNNLIEKCLMETKRKDRKKSKKNRRYDQVFQS